MKGKDYTDALHFARQHPLSYMATVEGKTPWNRAMQALRVDEDFTIWYCSVGSSNKIKQIKNAAQVCLSFNETGSDNARDLRVFGVGEIKTDPKTRAELWRDQLQQYFPKGKDDPEFALIKVKPTLIEYRDPQKHGLQSQVVWKS